MFDEITENDLLALGLAEFSSKIKVATLPAVHCLCTQSPSAGASKRSWMGGFPKVLTGFVWPVINDVPLTFIAQIDCGEVCEIAPELGWPHDGNILFFLFWPELPEFQVEDPQRSLCRVLFLSSAEIQHVLEPPIPAELRCPFLTPGFQLVMSRRSTLPSPSDDTRFNQIFGERFWPDPLRNRAVHLLALLNESAGSEDLLGRIGGYPALLQPPYGGIESDVLLFQFRDGGDGHWYFHINPTAFQKRDFKQARFHHDCY